tara:strand:+ start:255 stop:641 length:387 start_codon:yes stop_codon:yes gene_type:complete
MVEVKKRNYKKLRIYKKEFSAVFEKYSGRLKTAKGCLEVMAELVQQGPDILSTIEWDAVDVRFHQKIGKLPEEKYEIMLEKYNNLITPLENERWKERSFFREPITKLIGIKYSGAERRAFHPVKMAIY